MILNKYTLCENHQVNAHFLQFRQYLSITSRFHQQSWKGKRGLSHAQYCGTLLTTKVGNGLSNIVRYNLMHFAAQFHH